MLKYKMKNVKESVSLETLVVKSVCAIWFVTVTLGKKEVLTKRGLPQVCGDSTTFTTFVKSTKKCW